MMETETKCYNGHNDWFDAEDTFRQMLTFFRGGVSAYMYWNMVLDQTGLSSWGWSQDSTIVVDNYDGTVIYTPQYVLMKHISQFVKPGAVVMNTNRYDREMELHVGGESVEGCVCRGIRLVRLWGSECGGDTVAR